MRQIIPFKKELLFKTKISEITSISLEHTLSLRGHNLVSGEFHISGDYKMTQASINREKFYFTLPFEINLDSSYNADTINIDIDNFYYEVVNEDSLQVNIDVYVDGEKIEDNDDKELLSLEDVKEYEEDKNEEEDLSVVGDNVRDDKQEVVLNRENIGKEKDEIDIIEDNDTIEEINIKNNEVRKEIRSDNIKPKEIVPEQQINYAVLPQIEFELEEEEENKNNNVNKNLNNNVNINNNKKDGSNFNIFDSDIFNVDTYATYYVYLVKDEDNIDKIVEKFGVAKDDIANYNDLSNIKPGTKLIIPSLNE